VSSAATTISSPFQNKAGHSPDVSAANSTPTTPTETPASTPRIPDETLKDSNGLSAPPTPTTIEDGDKRKSAVETLRKRSSSHTGSRPNSVASVRSDNELNNAMQELDALQHLLSLELCLQLIHINKDAEHRVQRFVKVGFPGRLRTDM
jgi:recyclin-1